MDYVARNSELFLIFQISTLFQKGIKIFNNQYFYNSFNYSNP